MNDITLSLHLKPWQDQNGSLRGSLWLNKKLKLLSHSGHGEHRDMEAENGKEFDSASSKQIPQAFAFSFWFLNVHPSVASVITRSA